MSALGKQMTLVLPLLSKLRAVYNANALTQFLRPKSTSRHSQHQSFAKANPPTVLDFVLAPQRTAHRWDCCPSCNSCICGSERFAYPLNCCKMEASGVLCVATKCPFREWKKALAWNSSKSYAFIVTNSWFIGLVLFLMSSSDNTRSVIPKFISCQEKYLTPNFSVSHLRELRQTHS